MMKARPRTELQKNKKNRKFFLLKLICLSSVVVLVLLAAFNRNAFCVGPDENYGDSHFVETDTYEGRTYLKPITSLVGFNRKFMKRKASINI